MQLLNSLNLCLIKTPIHFDPFEIEIPDMEIAVADGGVDYLEEQIELEVLPIKRVLNQIPGEYEKLNYDYHC